jgi:hypothetical protein
MDFLESRTVRVRGNKPADNTIAFGAQYQLLGYNAVAVETFVAVV